MLVAIDIGGTFTDLMAFDEATGRFAQAKSLTTPAELVQGRWGGTGQPLSSADGAIHWTVADGIALVP